MKENFGERIPDSNENGGDKLQESYFSNIDKKVINEVVDVMESLKEYEPLIHTHYSIKKIIGDRFPVGSYKDIHDDSYFDKDSGWLEDMMEKNAIARLDHMVLAPGTDGFFQIEYLVKKDKKVLVGYTATDAQKSGFENFEDWNYGPRKSGDNKIFRELKNEEDKKNIAKMFKKFTGHEESFEVDLGQLKEMFANDKKIADSLIKEVEKTIEDQGEVTSYRDFINRLGHLE